MTSVEDRRQNSQDKLVGRQFLKKLRRLAIARVFILGLRVIPVRFHPGRVLGIILGIVILAAIAFLPFGSTNTDTLLSRFSSTYGNLNTIQDNGTTQDIISAYILLVASIVLIIAGLVGVFPLGTGVMGVVGMALITIAPYLEVGGSFITSDYGIGFVVIWIASIVSLGASFWHGKKKSDVTVQQNVVVQSPNPPPSPGPTPTQ